MKERGQVGEPLPSSYTVHREHYRGIRLYSGLRALAFGICIAICIGAILPNGTFTNSKLAIFFGIALLGGFVLAFNFSRAVLAVSFALPKRGRSVAIWKALGIVMATAYAAEAWDYVDEEIAYLTICLSGTGFFLVAFLGSCKLFFNPALGGALMQMVKEHDARKQRNSKT